MNQDFIQCLSDDVHVRADIAANLIYEYRDGKDPKFLKFAASSVYQMAHRVLMMYGLVRDNQCLQYQAAQLWAYNTIHILGSKENKLSDDKVKVLEEMQHALENWKLQKAMVDELKLMHPLLTSDFNKNTNLFNCLDGTLDLNTFELRQHNPDDLITKRADITYAFITR